MMIRDERQENALIPGLTDSLSLQCLARVPRADYQTLRKVSKLWRSALLSKQLYALRRRLGLQEPWVYVPFCSTRSATSDRARNWIQAYDPKENIWHDLTAVPDMNPGEFLKGFAFVAIEERLFVIGGRVCSIKGSCSSTDELYISKEVHVFNCITGKWSQCASMSVRRVDFACTVSNGFIFVAGGRSGMRCERGLSSAEVYVPQRNKWILLPSLNISRYNCVGVSLHNKVYVVGGFVNSDKNHLSYVLDRSSVEVYDPAAASGTWELVRTMWQVDVPPNQIVPVKGKLYSSGDVLNAWKGRVEKYDEKLNMWKIVDGSQRFQPVIKAESSLWNERGWYQRYLTMALVGESALYFIGGYGMVVDVVECDEASSSDTSSSSGKRRRRRRKRRMQESFNVLLEVVSVFDTKDKAWKSMEHLSTSCKELCGHCCTVSL